MKRCWNSRYEFRFYTVIILLITSQNQKNIIPYLALLETEADFKIITSYLDVEPLANIMGSINLELAFLIYRQIAGALQSLEDHGIEHNDINESTTLIEYKADRHMAYLTGFSEFSTAKADSSSGFQRDLCSLTQIVRSTLSTYKGQPCCDPGLESIISKALKKQLAASDVCHMLEEIATSYEGFPFRKLSITKVMSLKRIVDENNVEAIRLLDLLKIVLHHNAHSKSMDLLIRKVIRKERLFQLNNETFCYLEDAEKLMFHLKSNLSIFLDLSPPQHKEACWYETEHAIDFSISYHKPSGMVNITQILNLLDDNIVNSCLEGISPSYQQVCGSDQWEGYYIDSESTDEVLRRLNLETNQSYRMAHETPPRDIFYNNDPSQFIIIASPEMIGLVFLQRDGTAVKLNGNTKSVEATVQECEKHGLSVTARAVQTYIPSEPDWKSYDGTSQVIKRFDEPNCPSEATEHSSFYDPEERTRFTLRKRKAPSDVPVLPKPTRSRVEQTTVTEICQSWTKEVGADIRPSRFGKR